MATSSSNLTAATSLSSASSIAGPGAGSGATLYKQPSLARAASNASSTNGAGTGPRSHHSNSDSSPASPIDGSILGHNNPWSPTAQERLHFRELSVSLTPSTLTTDQQEILQQLQQPSASSVSPSPPGTSGAGTTVTRSSAYTDHSSPRRATSLNYHGMGQRNNRAAAIARDHSPGAGANASDSTFRQPQRRNTPVLPPLVTSSEALYNAVADQDGTPAQANNAVGCTGHTAPHQQVQPAAQAWHQQQQQQQHGIHVHGTGGVNGGPSSKIIRGPASAAAYVPPIGHTHAADAFRAGANISPEQATALHQLVGEGSSHHHHPFASQQHYHHVPQRPPGTQFQSIPSHFRAFTTAAPGVPETSYLHEKDRIAGGGGSGQVNQSQSGNHFVSPLSPSSILSPHTTGVGSGLNSAITMQFPSLNGGGGGVAGHNGNVTVDANTAVAFSNNLHLQQQLLAAQTHQLQEQQSQLAAALAAGLSLQDRSATTHHHQQQSSISSLPTSPPPSLLGGNTGVPAAAAGDDPYAIAAQIEALQRANALLVGSMQGQQGNMQHQSIPAQYQQQHQVQQNQHQQQHQHQFQQAGPLFAPFSPMMSQHVNEHSSGITAPAQASPNNGVSPVDIPALIAAKGYNPREFDTQPAQARFFVIKSFTEDDVFKSIKFEIWSSTVLGNNRLDKAFSESANKGPIYLFFSVNASGHFCGIAEMLTPLDYSVTSNVWAQGDKWKGVMKLRWIYIKDIPNPALRHLKLTNTNEQKPVTSSRDTQEVPYDQGCEMLRIFCAHQSKTSLLQGKFLPSRL
jgi:hypothetical protein